MITQVNIQDIRKHIQMLRASVVRRLLKRWCPAALNLLVPVIVRVRNYVNIISKNRGPLPYPPYTTSKSGQLWGLRCEAQPRTETKDHRYKICLATLPEIPGRSILNLSRNENFPNIHVLHFHVWKFNRRSSYRVEFSDALPVRLWS